jgi:hypothetical protein
MGITVSYLNTRRTPVNSTLAALSVEKGLAGAEQVGLHRADDAPDAGALDDYCGFASVCS